MKRFRGRYVLILSIIFCLFLLIGPVSAENNTDPTLPDPYNTRTGTSYLTIQEALNEAQDGDTIIVEEGYYWEQVEINKNISLNASGQVYLSGPGDQPVIRINSSGSGTKISGFTIQIGTRGIYLDSATDCTIDNNEIQGLDHSAFYGIYLNHSTALINNNHLLDAGQGIYLENSQAILNNNYISREYFTGQYGIYSLNSSLQANETYMYNLQNGICLFNSTGSIKNSLFTRSYYTPQQCGIYLENSLIYLESNRIFYADYGIVMWNSPFNTLKNNQLDNNQVGLKFAPKEFLNQNPPLNQDPISYIQNIDTSNTINNQPIYYLVNHNNQVLDENLNPGYLALVNCQNINITNLNVKSGILIVNSSQILTKNCTIKNLDNGLILINSPNITIENCTMESNRQAIYLYFSAANITGNAFNYNTGGVFLDYSSAEISANNFRNQNGIILQNSAANIFENGIYCSQGIVSHYSQSNITHNNLSCDYALYLYHSISNIIHNNITDNTIGILFWKSPGNFLRDNIFNYNFLNLEFITPEIFEYLDDYEWDGDDGFYYNIDYPDDDESAYIQDIDLSNTINNQPIYYLVNQSGLNINFSHNPGYIALINCQNIHISSIIRKEFSGILLVNTTNTILENCEIEGLISAITLIDSSGNSILNNKISSGFFSGIILVDSFSNKISDNIFEYTNEIGILLLTSTDNLISKNYFESYYHLGFINSQSNFIYKNMFLGDGSNYPEISADSQSTNNLFNIPQEGNWWSDYEGTDNDNNGWGDTPQVTLAGIDNYPIITKTGDLEITSTQIPVSGNSNETINVSWAVNNPTSNNVLVASTDVLYLSSDNQVDYDDKILLEHPTYAILSPYQSYTVTTTITIPPTPPGIYYLLLEVDSYQDTPETDESNNQKSSIFFLGTQEAPITQIENLNQVDSYNNYLHEDVEVKKVTISSDNVSGDMEGTLEISMDLVNIATGLFRDKGFFKGNWFADLEGSYFYGELQGASFLVPQENRIYLKGALMGPEIRGIFNGYLEPHNGIYDSLISRWQFKNINSENGATIQVNGTLNFLESSTYPSTTINVLQTVLNGKTVGYYNEDISTVLTELMISEPGTPYYNQGLSILSYSSNSGTGEGWTYNRRVGTDTLFMYGMLSEPLESYISGVEYQEETSTRAATFSKSSTNSLKLLFNTGKVTKTFLGPQLRLSLNGPSQAFPGQTFEYQVVLSNVGLTLARLGTLEIKLPSKVQYVSSSPQLDYYLGSHMLLATLDLAPGQRLKFTIKVKVNWHTSGDFNCKATFKLPKNIFYSGINWSEDDPESVIYRKLITNDLNAVLIPSYKNTNAATGAAHVYYAYNGVATSKNMIGGYDGSYKIAFSHSGGTQTLYQKILNNLVKVDYAVFAAPALLSQADLENLIRSNKVKKIIVIQSPQDVLYQTQVKIEREHFDLAWLLTGLPINNPQASATLLNMPQIVASDQWFASLGDLGLTILQGLSLPMEQYILEPENLNPTVIPSSQTFWIGSASRSSQTPFYDRDLDGDGVYDIITGTTPFSSSLSSVDVHGELGRLMGLYFAQGLYPFDGTYEGLQPEKDPTSNQGTSIEEEENQSSSISVDEKLTKIVPGHDPNIKYGPEGYVQPGEKLNYKIEFENAGEGNAYGVYFTDVLDPNLDESSLEIGSVRSTIDDSIIGPEGTYDPATRTITWMLSGDGEILPHTGGYANISVNVRSNVTDGTKILNTGTVYFPSVPEVTPTNTIFSLIDLKAPEITAYLPGRNYYADLYVNLYSNEPSTIYYTTDGSDPNSGTIYSGPIHITETTTLRFVAKDNAGHWSQPQSEIYTIKSAEKADLFLKTYTSNSNPPVGELINLTFKLGNNGPQVAKKVITTINIPEGLEVVTITGDGNYTYHAGIITWKLDEVPVGDPYLYVTLRTLRSGNFQIIPAINSLTMDQIRGNDLQGISINVAEKIQTKNKVNAISTLNNTVGMPETGTPLIGLVLAMLMLLTGLISSRKNQ